MDFALTDSQQLLATIAREFLDKRRERFGPTGRIGRPDGSASPRAPAAGPAPIWTRTAHESGRAVPAALTVAEDVWQEMAALGWPGLLIPPDLGGSGGSLLDVAVLVEEMGRAGLPGPYVTSAVAAASALLSAGSTAQQQRWLPGMAVGDRIVTLALVEDAGALTPDAIRCTLALPRDARAGRLDGTKRFVRDAHVAHALLVLACTAGGLTLVLIDRDRAGITLTPSETLSGEPIYTVELAGVEVRAADLVGTVDDGWRGVAPALQAGALARAAEMVGAAQRVLDLAVEHAKVRVQSGRPIGSFQAIQHACADLLRHVEGSRWIVRAAAWKAAEGLDAGTEVAMAKAWAGEACLAVARRAHQIFGAIGYCDEHPLHVLHKRIHAASVEYGDGAMHLETVARAIGLDD